MHEACQIYPVFMKEVPLTNLEMDPKIGGHFRKENLIFVSGTFFRNIERFSQITLIHQFISFTLHIFKRSKPFLKLYGFIFMNPHILMIIKPFF